MVSLLPSSQQQRRPGKRFQRVVQRELPYAAGSARRLPYSRLRRSARTAISRPGCHARLRIKGTGHSRCRRAEGAGSSAADHKRMNMQISRYKAGNFVLAALLLGASPELTLEAQVQASGARIAGKVVSSVSGEPLSRARVSVANLQERGQTKSLITGDDGIFEFRGLTAGKYSLSAARRGFIES